MHRIKISTDFIFYHIDYLLFFHFIVWVCFVADRLKQMHYLTNSEPHDEKKPPNNRSNNNWKRCRYVRDPQGVVFNVLCELNVSPYMQQFAILTDNNRGVAFREVEIYGYGE